MPSRSFARALLFGAGAALLVVLAVLAWRTMDAEPESPPRFDPAEFVQERPRLDAPQVATDYEVVDAMLALARVRPGDHVVDLGSGDGRILIAAARSHGARGLGVDIDPARVAEATANAQAAGVQHRVEFRRQDLFETSLREADVLTLYLTPEVNLRLRPRILEQMRPGTRVVSHDFDMGEWLPDQSGQVGTARILMWIVPADIGGRWTLNLGERIATLHLDQRFQQFGGNATYGDPVQEARIERGFIRGNRIRFIADLGEGRQVFEGRLNEGRIEPVDPAAGWRALRAG